MTIKKLKARVEEIGRDVDSGSFSQQTTNDDNETLYDILQQVRREKGISSPQQPQAQDLQQDTADPLKDGDAKNQLLTTSTPSNLRQRSGKIQEPDSKTSGFGFKDLNKTEDGLMAASATHESITADLLSMAAQLKQQSMAFQFSLGQDKNFVERAVEGLEGNMDAMGVASRGMKTLQRMSEEEGWLGRLKLQLMIAGLWMVAVLLVFVGPKLRF